MCDLFHALRRWKQCAFLCVMADLVSFTWVAVLCLEYETPFLIVHKFNGCCFVFRLRVFLGIIIYSYGSCLDALRWKHETTHWLPHWLNGSQFPSPKVCS